MRTLAPDIRTAAAAAVVAKDICDHHDLVTQTQAHQLALLVEDRCNVACGNGQPVKTVSRILWRRAKRVGIVPSGILFWIARIVLWHMLQRLVEHWLANGGEW